MKPIIGARYVYIGSYKGWMGRVETLVTIIHGGLYIMSNQTLYTAERFSTFWKALENKPIKRTIWK